MKRFILPLLALCLGLPARGQSVAEYVAERPMLSNAVLYIAGTGTAAAVLAQNTNYFYPEQFGALGAAGTNDDSYAWQATWDAMKTNVSGILDGRGRRYWINRTVTNELAADGENRQFKIQNAVLVTTNQNLTNGVLYVDANYLTLEHLTVGGDPGADTLSVGVKFYSPSPNGSAFHERTAANKLIITNFNTGLWVQNQDNFVLENSRILGCRSNCIYLSDNDQIVIKSTYWGFAYASPGDGPFGEDWFTGVGRVEWLTNCIGLEGYDGLLCTIEEGCAFNYARIGIKYEGRQGYGPYPYGDKPYLSISDSDIEATFTHNTNDAVIVLTNIGAIFAKNVMHVQGAGSNVWLWALDNTPVSSAIFINSGGNVNAGKGMRLFPSDGYSPGSGMILPRITGDTAGFQVVSFNPYNTAVSTNTVIGGNVPTTDKINTWTANQLVNGIVSLQSSVDLDFMLGADVGARGTYSGVNLQWSGFTRLVGAAQGSFLGYQNYDFAGTRFYRMMLGGDAQVQRRSPDQIQLWLSDTTETGTLRWNFTNSSLVPKFTTNTIGSAAESLRNNFSSIYTVSSNTRSIWPTAPGKHGDAMMVNSNGVVFLLTSGVGLTWTATNRIAP